MNTVEPFLVDTGKGFTLKYKNRFFYSLNDPLTAVNKKIKQLNFPAKTLVFIPSLGCGYGLLELAARLPADVHICCLEADRVLWDFITTCPQISIPVHDKLTILHTTEPQVLLAKIRQLGLHNFRKAILLPLCGGFGLAAGLYTRLFKFVEEEIRNFWQNKITLIHMAPLWLKNIFANLAFQQASGSMQNLKTARPVLVTGAGPSLEENLMILKAIRESVILITVDTAFPVLWQHGIKPDYILIVESQLANLWDFLPCINPGIPLICDLSSNALVLRLLQSECTFFCSQFHNINLFTRLRQQGLLPWLIPPLGSVGIAALYLALNITTGPVFFTGLDFSYSRQKTHSRGAPVNDLMLIRSNRLNPVGQWTFKAIRARPLLQVKDKQGHPLTSDLVLQSYAGQARQLINGTCGVYDLAACGMDLGAEKIHTLDEIRAILAKAATGLPLRKVKAEQDFGAINTKQVADFLQAEIRLLKTAAGLLGRELRQDSSAGTTSTRLLTQTLEAIDYVYLHFPDPVLLPCREPALLFRILISVKHYMVVLEKCIRGVNDQQHTGSG